MNIDTHFRFWSKVGFNGPVPSNRPELGPCWVWKGRLDDGYGKFDVNHEQARRAHTLAYELLISLIPPPFVPDHLCRNRACINPGHIEPVTNRENILRGTCRAARQAVQTHCYRGHELSGRNLIVHGRCRHCRTCKNIRDNLRRRMQRRERTNVQSI